MPLILGGNTAPNSGLFVDTVGKNFYTGSPTRADWNNTSSAPLTIALYTSSLGGSGSGNFAVADYNAIGPGYGVIPFNGGEVVNVSGTVYVAGGKALTNPSVLASTGVAVGGVGALNFNADSPVWGTVPSPASVNGIHGGLIYNSFSSGVKQAWCLLNFGSDYNVGGGSFSVIFGADGVFSIDVTP